jgi:hypothetical protein
VTVEETWWVVRTWTLAPSQLRLRCSRRRVIVLVSLALLQLGAITVICCETVCALSSRKISAMTPASDFAVAHTNFEFACNMCVCVCVCVCKYIYSVLDHADSKKHTQGRRNR